MTDHEDRGGADHRQREGGGLAMMVLMMACCMAVVLLFLLIPVVGWPIGLTIGASGIIAMFFVHQRMMSHEGHH